MELNLAVILAGGSGTRIEKGKPKQFLFLKGKMLFEYSLETFVLHPEIAEIYLVIHPDFVDQIKEWQKKRQIPKLAKILTGGETRQESSFNGIKAAPKTVDNVLIHDAARPCVAADLISRLILQLKDFPAAAPAAAVVDTIISVDPAEKVKDFPPRSELKGIQTPQAFHLPVISQAHQMARNEGLHHFPDDCSMVWHFNLAPIHIIDSSQDNIKVTHRQDLWLVEKILSEDRE